MQRFGRRGSGVGDLERPGDVAWGVRGGSRVEAGGGAGAGMPDVPSGLPAPGELPALPDEVVTTTVDIAGHLPAKLAGMRAHATQVTIWEGDDGQRAYTLSDGVARPICTVEQFTLASGRVDPASVRTDLFAGVVG